MKRNGTGETLCIVLLIAVSALFLFSFGIINFRGFPKYCSCDMYEDTAYSMLAWKAKSFFPDGWIFGNQYYIFATPVLCSLFYGLTGNINFSMALATTTMTFLIVLSMLFLIYPFTDKIGRFVGVTAILGCMVTANAALTLEGQLFYIFASYYSAYLITILIVTGDYFHALCFREKREPSFALMLSLVLCFISGMQSLRQTAILIIPIAATEIIRIFLLFVRNNRKLILRTRAVTLRVFLYAVSNILGVVYIRLFKIPHVEIYGALMPRGASSQGNVHEVNVRILQKITGFYYAIHENNGLIYYIPAFFFTGVVLFAAILSVRSIISRRHGLNGGREDVFGAFNLSVFAISLISLFILNHIFVINFRVIYMFVWYPFTAISCVVLFRHLKSECQKAAGVLFLCAACVGCWLTGYLPAVRSALKTDPPCTAQIISDYIVDQGYAYIYGDWGVVCPIAAYTNGKALAACAFKDPLEILGYINPQNVYGDAENADAVYVFFGDQHLTALEYACRIDAKMTLVKEFENGCYKLYVSDRQLMHYGASPLPAG
ncbi:MAG: hypothetical protein VB064_10925 [Oscillospiraceae bacterium]|nr:hypothetical protein [Oscillospiraceae bacterium]